MPGGERSIAGAADELSPVTPSRPAITDRAARVPSGTTAHAGTGIRGERSMGR